jgi:exopolyphosphatase / guanosine-5'-triphosphate,3'-diphosphate pyrophosphatase
MRAQSLLPAVHIYMINDPTKLPRLAAMDIGTNSARLLVVEVNDDYTWTTIAMHKEVVRLGEGEFKDGHPRLLPEAIERGAVVCTRFADMAKSYGADEIIALATAATREAENQDEFVERIHDDTHGYLDVRVISGDEEARLIYLGVRSGVEQIPGERALFMDIGGGSTELIVGDSARYYFLDSMKVGAIRLTSAFLEGRTGAVPPMIWSSLQRHVRSTLAPAARAIQREGFVRMFGSSGTIISLAEIAARRAHPLNELPTSMRNFELTLSELEVVTQILCKMTLEERRKVPGLSPERADIVIAGAAILQTVMEVVGAKSIFISDRGLREGIVIDQLLRDESAKKHLEEESVRARSTNRLARRSLVDVEHADKVAKLALSIFDQTRLLGLHELEAEVRELLHYGALLHDCGFFVSHTAHHLHSYYLIRHSELLGFNDVEVEVIAQIALHHRKALPRRRDVSFTALPEHYQDIVRILSCCVRLAESLERSHMGLIQQVVLAPQKDQDRILMTLHTTPGTDASIEFWAVQNQASAFEKTFRIPLDVVVAGAPAATRL